MASKPENLNGVWKYKSSEKFDDYMKEIGVSFAMRKLGNLAKPKVTIQINDSVFYLKSESLRNFEINGKLDVEFDETPPDGRKCKSTITWDGSKLIHIQKWDGKETSITRYINDSGELVMELVMNQIKCVRVYTKG